MKHLKAIIFKYFCLDWSGQPNQQTLDCTWLPLPKWLMQSYICTESELVFLSAVPISNVTLRAQATNLVEFNDTAVLMCSVFNGSSLSYVWLNGSSVVTPSGGAQLSDGGATLTMRVTRYDEGPFRCNASNGISYEISPPVHLNISCEFPQHNLKD